ncbi:MAG TPA: type III-B CRISPR module-associated protein Cmr5 [Streptosporangiaceae bacterium]|nr:type III-B CRISPR module-associated protein Cmr5 [Streptosporangiaceae bacterium]
MTVRRIDQGMAAAAARALPQDLVVDKELRTRYRQLRVMLHTAGLAATYAFIASKAGDTDGGPDGSGRLAGAYRQAGDAIRGRLSDMELFPGGARPAGVRDVMAELGKMDPVQYARASAEAAALVGWLSRLADAAFQETGGRSGHA